MKIKKSLSIFSFFLTLSLIAFISVSHAATISGSIYESDGTTLITGTWIEVVVWQGDPCGWRDWVTSEYTNTGLYTTPDLSEGTYYLQTSNMNQSNYVNKWWADPVSTIFCSGAQSIMVSTADITGKDFQLDVGYSISGMVYQSDGITPIPDGNIGINYFTGDPCDDRELIGYTWPSGGAYTIMGIPPGDYYLLALSNNWSIYASEWWAESESVFYCFEAQPVTVVNANVTNKNYQLDIGGSVTGVVVNDSGVPQANLIVTYDNDLCEVWKRVNTAIDGSFEIVGLPPGPVEIKIKPDADTWLVSYDHTYSCLALGENSDLGTIEIPYGALITGVVHDAYGNPLSDIEVWCGAKFEVSWDETDVDGSFELRVPVGNYTLNIGDEDEYSAMPVEITVNDVGTPQDLGVLTVYDSSSGEQISGTVDYGEYSGTGEFFVLAFLNTTEITPENINGFNILAEVEPDQVTGEYSLNVVPQAVRSGTTIKVMLFLIKEDFDNWLDSGAIVDKIEGIETSPTPVTGQNLAYSTSGSDYTVSGFVKNGEGGVVYANVLLYKQPSDEFFGFAETDCDGAYALYNVPAGTYRIAATAYGYDATEWTATFNVVDSNVTVPDIFMGSFGDELALDCGPAGLWDYDGTTWMKISGSNPEGMTGWTDGLAMDFGGLGLWNFDGTTWMKISGSSPEGMTGWANGLAMDFEGLGLWNFDGTTWMKISGYSPEGMTGWSGGLAMDFGGIGLWNFDGTTWMKISGSSPEDMAGWSGGLAMDFGGLGLWNFDGTTWMKISGSSPEGMTGWANGLAMDFGGLGLWNFDGTTWMKISGSSPEGMTGWANGLAMDFGGLGLWNYDGTTWMKISGADVEDMDDVDLY